MPFLDALKKSLGLMTGNGSMSNQSCIPLKMSVQLIGSSGAGKTTLDTALRACSVGHALESGLLFGESAEDPAAAIKRLNRTQDRVRDLQNKGMATTLVSHAETLVLHEGEQPRIEITINECVGQALTNPDGSEAFSEQFKKHSQRLAGCDVIWIYIPVPQDPGNPGESSEYDVQIANTLLRSALKRHVVNHHRVVVAILLTQVDAVFGNADEARQSLDESVLSHLLRPLINTIRTSAVIGSGAVIPVSAFGFQNAVVHRIAATPATGVAGDPRRARPGFMSATSLLEKNQRLRPWNLRALLPWTVLQSMLLRQVNPHNGQAAIMKSIALKLREDLDKLEPWVSVIR